ncbi:hypothetical protein Pint_13593 [Pistacia integerrima]|uniref:Uncharacterized protein n=1 Tax=Pistacia integerrima TaxID=434235 RepID=A0ACC0Y4J2_9ROSI|nr:hypothetical protein Pint_13593 [Pistacia integerrima]
MVLLLNFVQILLRGASGDDLKKVKHVVQYGVFAAYHLALETSFLADEGASLPELPLKSPITVALPEKPSNIDRSISTVPGFMIPATGKPSSPQPISELQKSNNGLISDGVSTINIDSLSKLKGVNSTSLSEPSASSIEAAASSASLSPTGQNIPHSYHIDPSPKHAFEEENKVAPKEFFKAKIVDPGGTALDDHAVSSGFGTSDISRQDDGCNLVSANSWAAPELLSKQDNVNNCEEMGSSKEEFPPSTSDHQSILVSLSTRCVWKGTVCERAHLLRIKYYNSFDKPLGRFLRDHLFDQSYRCRSCDQPSDAHVHCYTHRQGSLTISVKKLPEFLLPGEREGKIWMWHRCLRCPRTNGFPPATRRVVMSDAAWGLSFGKFLELSFSNHAAASRVASCGHSLHRDCLRFYGFGRMVACFRYASIDVHSVYLPPSKLEFNYDNQDWMQKEANEVCSRAEFLFNEVYNALHQISVKIGAGSEDGGMKITESRLRISELEGILQRDKSELEESLRKAVCKDVKLGQPAIDILEINKLRRQILFHSYVWDQRLIHAASLVSNSCIPKLKEKPVSVIEKFAEVNLTSKPGKGFSSCDSFLLDRKPDLHCTQGGVSGDISEPDGVHKQIGVDQDLNLKNEGEHCQSVSDKFERQESGKIVRRALSEGEFPVMANLSDTLDAAWTGENHQANINAKENDCSLPDPALFDSSTMVNSVSASSTEQGGAEVLRTLSSVLSTKGTDNVDYSKSWAGMPFLNFYSSFNKNTSLNAQKLAVVEYNPTYVLSYRDLERQSGARLLLPVGVNDTVVPVYDDEPTSIIAYALISSDYHVQISESERLKDAADSAVSDSVNLSSVYSFDDTSFDSFKNLGSTDESILSMSGSRGSQVLDPLSYTKDLHARISFADDGPLGKVKYTVTCYYAKRFDALRRKCCPSELDFIRSLSRCKKWEAQGGKSNVFFAKTLDDRFIVKQVTKTELESFIKFGPAYFKYLSHSIGTGSPTCLAKILGIYQVLSKHLKGGKETKMDVLVMENLLFRRTITRLYDLKGSSRSRYNPDTSGSNKVLLDQNLIETMPTSPIFVGNRAKRLLERAVWNDTAFLASIDVMDYSLLVGVDEEKHELVLGIIDFMRQYTWDKHLETWVKTTGILGGPKNTTPTVISPQQYKKRFRKAMSAYFLMVPDQWSSPMIIRSESQSDLCEENTQGVTSFDS